MMEKRKVKIYYTSDVHGYFYPTSYGDREVKPMGLFACASEYKKDDDTLVIDGGDMLQGSAYAYYSRNILGNCEYIAQMVNDCGYDFYTLGNHDFNYGQEYQVIYRNNHKGTCVCENVLDGEGNILYPHVIHTMKNGVKVGLVGIVTDYINVWEKKENLVGIQVVDPFEAAKKALEDLQGKVDLTICIYHGGFESDLETGKRLSETTENIGYKICTELGFDVLLTGKDLPILGAPARRYVPAGSKFSMIHGRDGKWVSISSGMEKIRILPNCLFVSSKVAILSVRASADGCSPSGATDGSGAVVSLSSHMAASCVLFDPFHQLVSRHQQPLADPQGGKGGSVQQLVGSGTGNAQCRGQLIGIQHRGQVFVVVVHV